MATPRADYYSAKSGESVRGGPMPLPAWLAGAQPLQLVKVPEAVSAGSLNSGGNRALNAYSGFTVREASSEVFFACQGGHDDGGDNGVISLDLRADAPSWVVRRAASPATYNAVSCYYADGTPAARHVYHYIHWPSQIDRLVLPGCRFAYGSNTPTAGNVDIWNPGDNTWSTTGSGANPSVGGSYGVVCDKATGDIWAANGMVYSPTLNTVTVPGTTGSWGWSANSARFPAAYDSKRRRAFFFQWGQGEGYNSGVNASELDFATRFGRVITFNAGTALDKFVTDSTNGSSRTEYLGMDYDAKNDRYLVRAKDCIYEIKPNATAVWDITVLTTTGISLPYSASALGGRFKYVPALQGFIEMADAAAGCHFLKV